MCFGSDKKTDDDKTVDSEETSIRIKSRILDLNGAQQYRKKGSELSLDTPVTQFLKEGSIKTKPKKKRFADNEKPAVKIQTPESELESVNKDTGYGDNDQLNPHTNPDLIIERRKLSSRHSSSQSSSARESLLNIPPITVERSNDNDAFSPNKRKSDSNKMENEIIEKIEDQGNIVYSENVPKTSVHKEIPSEIHTKRNSYTNDRESIKGDSGNSQLEVPQKLESQKLESQKLNDLNSPLDMGRKMDSQKENDQLEIAQNSEPINGNERSATILIDLIPTTDPCQENTINDHNIMLQLQMAPQNNAVKENVIREGTLKVQLEMPHNVNPSCENIIKEGVMKVQLEMPHNVEQRNEKVTKEGSLTFQLKMPPDDHSGQEKVIKEGSIRVQLQMPSNKDQNKDRDSRIIARWRDPQIAEHNKDDVYNNKRWKSSAQCDVPNENIIYKIMPMVMGNQTQNRSVEELSALALGHRNMKSNIASHKNERESKVCVIFLPFCKHFDNKCEENKPIECCDKMIPTIAPANQCNRT